MTLSPKFSPEQRIAVFGAASGMDGATAHELGRFKVSVSGGQITTILWDGIEVARGLSYLLRDENWATCTVTSSLASGASNQFAINGDIDENGIRFAYQLQIMLDSGGALVVQSRGEALSDFKTNRVGLTFLHPVPDTVGSPLEITHTDGSRTSSKFPILIQPSQPAFDIAGMRYPLTVSDNVTISFDALRADGSQDCFEMEDQRNWGDASYKTYIGSLLDPWPFVLRPGDVLHQSVRIGVEKSQAAAQPVSINPDATHEFRLPAIGTSIPLGAAREALENIRKYGPPTTSFVSANLRSDRIDSPDLEALREIAASLACPLRLELEVHNDPASEIAQASNSLEQHGLNFSHVLACPAPYLKSYQPDAEWPDYEPLDTFYDRVRTAFPNSETGGGMLTYFTELNRKWPPLSSIDFIGHAYCPIVHAADDETVLQNVATLPLIARTIAETAPSLPYDIVSMQLSMRSNPYGAGPVPNTARQRLAMADADPREDGEFAGLWMLAIAKALGKTHVRSYCLGALAGPASLYSASRADGRRPSFAAFDALAHASGGDQFAFETLAENLRHTEFKLGWQVLKGLLG